MPEGLEVCDAAKSGDGPIVGVGVKAIGDHQCPDCWQKSDTEQARKLHCLENSFTASLHVDEASSNFMTSTKLDAELRNCKSNKKCITANVPKFVFTAILTAQNVTNINSRSEFEGQAASSWSGSDIDLFDVKASLGEAKSDQRKASRVEAVYTEILMWLIDVQKWFAAHIHEKFRQLTETRRRPRRRPRLRFKARINGRRRWKATRRKQSGCKATEQAVVAKKTDPGLRELQNPQDKIQQAVTGHEEVQAKKETRRCTPQTETRQPSRRKETSHSVKPQGWRWRQIREWHRFSSTHWGIENAVQKIADVMRQERRRVHNIMMIAEEDLTRAKEKMTEWGERKRETSRQKGKN